MKLSDARYITKEWQEALKLGNWTITVRWGTKKELTQSVDGTNAVCDGCIWWGNAEYKQAEIALNRNMTYGDIVKTIKHELLHLRLEGHKQQGGKYDKEYEFGLNCLSDLL
jgi:hypothetical protein